MSRAFPGVDAVRPAVAPAPPDRSQLMGSNACAVVESVKRMPTISAFYGILIRMFFK
jgi:hypothetical protein